MTTPASNLANSQPDLVLPVEIMIQIFQDYAAFRSTELPIMTSWGPYSFSRWYDPGTQRKWPIIPILRACKLLEALMLPQVYRDIHVSGGTFLKLLKSSNLQHFMHFRTLRFSSLEYNDENSTYIIGLFGRAIEDRVLQSQLVHFQEFERIGRGRSTHLSFDSSTSSVANYRAWWLREKCPKLDLLQTDYSNIPVLAALSLFFRPERIVLDGFRHEESIDSDFLDLKLYHSRPKLTFNIALHEYVVEQSEISTPWITRCSDDITLNLGWKTRISECLNIKAHTLLSDLLRRFRTNRGRVTVCPYIAKDDNENNQHAWCFPKKLPSIDIPSISKSYRLRYSYPTVRFESSCKCGNGDNTGFWNDCEAKLIESIKVMMREDELDGDEYDLWSS